MDFVATPPDSIMNTIKCGLYSRVATTSIFSPSSAASLWGGAASIRINTVYLWTNSYLYSLENFSSVIQCFIHTQKKGFSYPFLDSIDQQKGTFWMTSVYRICGIMNCGNMTTCILCMYICVCNLGEVLFHLHVHTCLALCVCTFTCLTCMYICMYICIYASDDVMISIRLLFQFQNAVTASWCEYGWYYHTIYICSKGVYVHVCTATHTCICRVSFKGQSERGHLPPP